MVNVGLSSASYKVRYLRQCPHLFYPLEMLAIIFFCGFGYSNLIPLQGYISVIVGLSVVAIHLLLGGMNASLLRPAMRVFSIYLIYYLLALSSLFVFAIDQQEAFSLFATTVIAFIIGCYLACHFAGLPPSRLIRVFIVNAWVAAIIMFGFLIQYGINLRATGDVKVDANINTLAMYLILGLGASLLDKSYIKMSFLRGIWKVCLPLGVFLPAIAISYSRGAFAFVIIMVVVAIVRKLRYLRFLPFWVLLLGISASIWFILVADLNQPTVFSEWRSIFAERVDSRSEYGELREFVYAYGWQQFADNPVFGVGYSNFMYLFGRFGGMAIRSHNDLFEIFVEMGVVGGGMFVLILTTSAREWWRLSKNEDYRPIAYLFLLVVMYMFVRPMQTTVIWYLFLFFPIMVRNKRHLFFPIMVRNKRHLFFPIMVRNKRL